MSKDEILEELANRIVSFDLERVGGSVQKALEAGISASEIIEKGIGKGMLEVGEKYEEGEYFLSELMAAATVTKAAIEVLEPVLKRPEEKRKILGAVVIGTVKGDLHDIGKNIVAALLTGAGFTVHDLGVDVTEQKFIDEARRTSANIVAMSALLTTTLPAMGDVIKVLVNFGLRGRVKVLIGGTNVTGEFSKQIGADAYANDAVTGIRLAKQLMTSR